MIGSWARGRHPGKYLLAAALALPLSACASFPFQPKSAGPTIDEPSPLLSPAVEAPVDEKGNATSLTALPAG
jgi:hypothetical protein